MPSAPPTASATASMSSMLRPRKESMPCMISMKAPNPTEIRNKVDSQRLVRSGRAHNHRKVKPPNRIRCVHLSINGTSTLGRSWPGVKQPMKISKVHSTAKNLACLLYGESGLNIRFIIIPLPVPCMLQRQEAHLHQRDCLLSFSPSSLCRMGLCLRLQDRFPGLRFVL